jgi:hypothetical protein
MASPDTLVFDLATPRRPALDDLGGGGKVQTGTPDPARHLTANDVNQWAKVIERLALTAPMIVVSVDYDGGGVPYVYQVASVAGAHLAPGDFTVTHTGTGDVTVAWPAGKVPPPGARPTGTINSITSSILGITQPTALSVRVRTRTDGGVSVDVPFTVSVF